MGKKLTIEYIKHYASLDGTVCNQDFYEGSMSKINFICPNNHSYKIDWNKFQQNRRCGICSRSKIIYKKSITIEYIQEYSKKENIKCISSEYESCDKHLIFECSNKHIFKMSWDNFKNGYRCSECAGNKKKTIEEIKEYISSYNYICNSDTYINSKTYLKLICPNGHSYKAPWSAFKFGNRCEQCQIEYRVGENHHNWNPDRTRNLRAQYLSFDMNKIKILYDDFNYIIFLFYKHLSKNKEILKNLYQVDHIYPRIAFIDNNLDKLYDKRIIKKICNLRENLRIIKDDDNIIKSGKYNQEKFINWFNIKIMKENNFVFA